MKKLKVGINGFGRIGRVTLRLLLDRPDIEVVAVNDLTAPEANAHLLQYDSVHGTLKTPVAYAEGLLRVGNHNVALLNQKDPAEIPWSRYGAELVFECTGVFTSYDGAVKHTKGGAKRVILSAPAKDDKIRTFVMGVNQDQYDAAKDVVVSNGSCTTNCLAPIAKVLNDRFGIERGLMTTVHSYTNDQRVLDLGHSDPRRMRAAALNMIPTTTGAAKAVALVIPELKGKLTGLAVRVPTPNVSLVDFVCDVKKATSAEEVNQAFVTASQEGPLKGILQAVNAPLVSSDYNGSRYSSSVDLPSTMVIDGTMVKVLSWYDNETGFSQRMIDLALLMSAKGL
jgi:glyceraldehyde 3-phosphate dehydrogenase